MYMKAFLKFFYFFLQYIGVIEVVFQIKSSTIIVGIYVNYLFGKKELQLISGQLIDRNRMEFSIQRFIEKNVNIPICLAKLILPSELFVNKVLTIPASAKSKIQNVVVSSIESMGIFDISSLSYNYKIVGEYQVKDRKYLKVLVSAIKINLVSEYITYFRNLGISLKEIVSATVGNVGIFSESSQIGAVAVVVNKQEEILVSIVSRNQVIKLEIIEISDRNVLENYIVSFISDFVKERSLFLEKILLFYFDMDTIERIFDRINIITISGELLPEYSWINEKFMFIDIVSYAKQNRFYINVLPKSDRSKVNFDVMFVRLSFVLTLLTIVGIIFIILTSGEVQRYWMIKKGIEENVSSTSPEIERYVKVIDVKNKMNEYEKYISSFYDKFSNKDKYSVLLYEVFRSLDKKTWLREIEVFPKAMKIKGFSENDTSFYSTIKNLSESSKFKSVKVDSITETSLEGSKVFKFEIEVQI